MRLGERRIQTLASLGGLVVIALLALACRSNEENAYTVAPTRPTLLLIGDDGPLPTSAAVAVEAEIDLHDARAVRASSTTESDDGESSSSSTETTMAPSTTDPTRRPTTPVTLSTKRPPTGPGIPPIPPYSMSYEETEFFKCVVHRESGGNPSAINPSTGAAGLFQFMQSTWDATARHIGWYHLVGVNPALAPVDLQYFMAHILFLWQGTQPWSPSDGCQLPPRSTTTTAPPLTPTTTPDTVTVSTTTTTTRPPKSTTTTG